MKASHAEKSTRSVAARLRISPEELEQRRARGERRCTKCREWKPLEDFGILDKQSDRRAYQCAACVRRRNSAERVSEQWTPERVAAFIAAGGCEAFDCKRPGTFVLADGSRACARHLKARVKERRAGE